MKSVIIMGGGIGGLTAAHELSKLGYDVSVYERNARLGGLARSKFNSNNLPCSYSWRVYGQYYLNLRKILNEIPLTDAPNKSVLDNLIDIDGYYIGEYNDNLQELKSTGFINKIKGIRKFLKKFTAKDIWITLKTFIYLYCICDKRLESYDNISWKNYMGQLSPYAKNYVIRSLGPLYGMDIDNVSVFAAVNCFYSALTYLFLSAKLSVMNAPTNIAWFDHWQSYLTSKSVKFYLNHHIDEVAIKNGSVQQISVTNKDTNEKQTMTADYYICDLSIEEVAKRFHSSDTPPLPKWNVLADKSRQLQLSIQLYLDDRLVFPDKRSIVWLPASPWALVIESQLTLWRNYDYVQSNIKDILSVGICDWSTKGLKVNKAFIDCTLDEVIDEVWHQIKACPGLHKLSTIKNKSLNDIKILDHYIWDSFYINDNHKIDSWEPKYSNNTECYDLTPGVKGDINNLFFATAYTKNSSIVFNMDSAAESGLDAAKQVLLCDQQPTESIKIVRYKRPLSRYIGWIRKIDSLIYKKK